MAGILRTLFKSKKSKKEEADNNEDLAREVSNRRSFRAPGTSSKSQRRVVAHFADDGALSATAAYHTKTAPKFKKGPQSCPGGYREESDVSYESDKYSQKSNSHRRRDVLHQSMRQNYTIDEGRKPSKSGRRHHGSKSDFRRHGESSEYGSGDPSPVGQYSSRHSHYEDRIEESENDDFSEKAQFAVIERAQQHYMQKYKESEQKRREEKRKLKDMEKECNDAKNAMFHYMNQLDKVKKERDCYRKELSRCKKQLELMQNNGFDAFHHHRQPQMSNPQQFPPALSMGYNYMNQPMNSSHLMQASFMNSAPPSSNTPMTMTSGGAGESLTNPSDVSFLQNSFMQPSSQVLSGITPSPGFKVPINFGDDDADEVKDYRTELNIETARCRKPSDDISISPSSSADSQVTLLDQSTLISNNKENRKPPTRSFSMMSI
ncbi:hypothetical protein GCK72_005314 [Caenorhabditis remanei]|uniref:Uncharacterized protein n=1 Tax=Caenorhabditis remanei TaxID=31234 RepID=A0A6A5HGY7_CAERE|nr:hypothetical protein GCK72_005314 [Caenorhabditis remanei]KAF1765362.1 hypothetical protein GCK72_005314 [Caenorhabditis remanei]